MTKIYKIEKGIKVPPPVRKGGGLPTSKARETMNALKAGESFLVRDALEGLRSEKVMRDMLAMERRNGGGREFVSRRLKAGVRIWRTK